MRMTIAIVAALVASLLVGPAPAATSTSAPVVHRSASAERVALSTLKKRVIALTNKKRVNHGCARVKSNAALGRAAQKHTKLMAEADILSHQLAGEPSLLQRYRNEGYNPSWWGENIAYNQATARQVVNSWMASAGHRRNILNCNFKHIGIGYAKNTAGAPFWTQDFGKKR